MTANINSFSYIDYFISGETIVKKNVFRSEPEQARDQVIVVPFINFLNKKNIINIDMQTLEKSDNQAPDFTIKDINGEERGIEHTRIFDSQQHFLNRRYRLAGDEVLDESSAPLNLLIRTLNNTSEKEVREVCARWSTWDTIQADNIAREMKERDSTSKVGVYGLKIADNDYVAGPRIYLHNTPSDSLEQSIEASINRKISRYGGNAQWMPKTILLLDDETRSHAQSDISNSALQSSSLCNNSFMGVYLISFNGVVDGNPTWNVKELKGIESC